MKRAAAHLNWKSRGDGCYDALASRVVGGKYFIRWEEGYYSDHACAWVKTGRFCIDYQTEGGGGIGNVDQSEIRTLEAAKALAEAHHQKYAELISRYSHLGKVPYEGWSQFRREMLVLQGLV